MEEPDTGINLLTEKVIGAAIEVHRALGPGYLESVYENAMCVELGLRNIAYERQADIPLMYKGERIGNHRLDLLLEGVLVVELKAVERLAAIHTAQVMSYLKATGHQLGSIINFNVPVVKDGIKRVVLT